MAKVYCDECLRTYRPYSYSETLERAIVSGVDELQGEDNKHNINDRKGYISCRDNIRNLFPSVDDLNVCHGKFNKERKTKISASFLCFDCEKYLCAKCITKHSEHFTFSEDDKNNMNKWDKIETKMIEAFNAEGDTKEEYIKQERAVLCNVIDVRDSVSVREWEKFMSSERKNVYQLGRKSDRGYPAWDICILNDNQTFLIINYMGRQMKIYNNSSYVLIDTIELPYIPGRITEITAIPSTDLSQSLIAVSFPNEGHIDIMNIQRRPAEVISSINVQDRCYDLAYCNNKLIARCEDYLDGEHRKSIHVMDISGGIINIIDLRGIWLLYDGSGMSVHSESETIYLCHGFFGVTCLSFTGQILHTTRFTDPSPRHICVDRDQNVYVMGPYFPLYKLTSDLGERVKVIDEDVAYVGRVTSIVHHKNKIYMVSWKGLVYIFNVD